MKKLSFSEDFFTQDSKAASFINDWYDLSLQIGVQPYLLSYAKKQRDKMQQQITLTQGKETRVVYNTKGCLKLIQNRLLPLMSSLVDNIPHDHMLAYRKGINATEIISEQTDKAYLIKFDIKKYYDHITSRKIRDMLMTHGFTRLGAQLIAHYCVVKRKISGDRIIQTLQQGSSVSPVISNLVGYEYIDKPVIAYLEKYKAANPNITYAFYRYSDNIAIWLDNEGSGGVDIEDLKEFKSHIQKELGKVKLRTHKWGIIPNTHPKRNQKFLGVVLNKIARIDKAKYEKWRATLFNACKNGVEIAACNYWNDRGRWWDTVDEDGYLFPKYMQTEVDTKKFLMVVRGRNSYLNSISDKQKLELTKLLEAAKHLQSERSNVYTDTYNTIPTCDLGDFDWSIGVEKVRPDVVRTKVCTLAEEKLNAVKRYKLRNETVEEFIEVLKAA